MAGCFSKPLRGRLFNVFREIIIGWKHVSEVEIFLPPPYKERVGKMDEFGNANFSFNGKTYVDTLLQK